MVLSNDQRDLINDPSYIFTDKIAFQNILHCEAVTPVLLSHVHRRLYLDSIEPVFDIFLSLLQLRWWSMSVTQLIMPFDKRA